MKTPPPPSQPHDLHLDVLSDFGELRNAVSASKRGRLPTLFDDRQEGPFEGLWLSATDRAGEIVCVQAARVVDASNGLEAFAKANLYGLCAYPLEVDFERTETQPFDHEDVDLRRVVYVSELWCAPTVDDRAVGTELTRWYWHLILRQLRPTLLIGLREDSRLGQVTRGTGFRHVHRNFIEWRLRDDLVLSDAILWTDASDARRWLSGPTEVEEEMTLFVRAPKSSS